MNFGRRGEAAEHVEVAQHRLGIEGADDFEAASAANVVLIEKLGDEIVIAGNVGHAEREPVLIGPNLDRATERIEAGIGDRRLFGEHRAFGPQLAVAFHVNDEVGPERHQNAVDLANVGPGSPLW